MMALEKQTDFEDFDLIKYCFPPPPSRQWLLIKIQHNPCCAGQNAYQNLGFNVFSDKNIFFPRLFSLQFSYLELASAPLKYRRPPLNIATIFGGFASINHGIFQKIPVLNFSQHPSRPDGVNKNRGLYVFKYTP